MTTDDFDSAVDHLSKWMAHRNVIESALQLNIVSIAPLTLERAQRHADEQLLEAVKRLEFVSHYHAAEKAPEKPVAKQAHPHKS